MRAPSTQCTLGSRLGPRTQQLLWQASACWARVIHVCPRHHPLLPKEVTPTFLCRASVLANPAFGDCFPAFCSKLSPSAFSFLGSLLRRRLGAPALVVVFRMSNTLLLRDWQVIPYLRSWEVVPHIPLGSTFSAVRFWRKGQLIRMLEKRLRV